MRLRYRPSKPPTQSGYALGSRTAKRRTMRSRVKRLWREILAFVVVATVAATAIIVINVREDEPQKQAQQTWMDHIHVSGAVGRIPTLSLSGPVSVASSKIIELEKGDGRVIEPDSPLIVSIMTFDGQTGKLLSADERAHVEVGQANQSDFDATLLEGVVGRAEGSRILFVRPVNQQGRQKTELNVVDIMHSAASGEPVEDPGKPLKITMTDTGPKIDHPKGDPPQTLTVQSLVEGEGQQVQSEDNVLVQYVMASWGDSVVHESTWWTGVPQVINVASAMPGVRVALLDQRVGSRLAVTIPPEMASGDATLTMVIDIIATEPKGGKLTPITDKQEESAS